MGVRQWPWLETRRKAAVTARPCQGHQSQTPRGTCTPSSPGGRPHYTQSCKAASCGSGDGYQPVLPSSRVTHPRFPCKCRATQGKKNYFPTPLAARNGHTVKHCPWSCRQSIISPLPRTCLNRQPPRGLCPSFVSPFLFNPAVRKAEEMGGALVPASETRRIEGFRTGLPKTCHFGMRMFLS